MLAFCYRYQLDPDELGVLYDVKDDRIVFPVMHEGKIVDGRRAIGKRLPKWKKYGKSGCHTRMVVVKSQLLLRTVSAAVVGGTESFVGVALLGTSLQESHKGYSRSSQQQ